MFQFARFAPRDLCIQSRVRHCWRGFPHSDICGSKLVCQLPAAFRRLPRPSSPVIAKASTICTYSLDPITLKVTAALLECACCTDHHVLKGLAPPKCCHQAGRRFQNTGTC